MTMSSDTASELRGVLFGRWAFVPDRLLDLLAVAPKAELVRSLERVRRLKDAGLRVRALTVIAPRMPEAAGEELLQQALATARGLKAPWRRAEALGVVGRSMYAGAPSKARAEIFRAIDEVADPYWCASAIATVADLHPELTPDLMSRAQAIPRPVSRFDALLAVARAAQEPVRTMVVAPALAAARRIADPYAKARALAAATTVVDRGDEEQVLADAMTAVRRIEHDQWRAAVLKELVPRLSDRLRRRALTAAQHITRPEDRARALAWLAPVDEAVASAREIADPYRRFRVLVAIASDLDRDARDTVADEALEAVCAIASEHWRAVAAGALAGVGPEPLVRSLLDDCLRIESDECRLHALADLAPHVPRDLLETLVSELLRIAWTTGDVEPVARTLRRVGGDVPDPVFTLSVEELSELDNDERARPLAALAPYIPARGISPRRSSSCENCRGYGPTSRCRRSPRA